MVAVFPTISGSCPSTTSHTLHYRVLDTISAFEKIEPAWQELLSETRTESLFLQHGWLIENLRTFRATPFIILVEDSAGELVAAAPFRVIRTGLLGRLCRRIQCIGSGPDLYDWTAFPQRAEVDTRAVLETIASALLDHQHQWDLLDHRFFFEAAPLQQLSELLAAHLPSGSPWEIQSPMGYHRLPLPVATEAYLQKKSLRKKLNNARNHMAVDFPEQSLRLTFVSPQDADWESQLDAFFKTYKAYWQERNIATNAMRYPALGQFYKRMFARYGGTDTTPGTFLFSQLLLEDTPVSAQFVLREKQTWMSYLICYDADYARIRPGMLHFNALIRQAIESGAEYYSLGRGDEAYKQDWTTEVAPLYSLVFHQPGVSRRLSQADDSLKQFLKRFNASSA